MYEDRSAIIAVTKHTESVSVNLNASTKLNNPNNPTRVRVGLFTKQTTTAKVN